ncbi:MAG: hypothetical protein V1833_01115 [Elusimicrobiota bacterium]
MKNEERIIRVCWNTNNWTKPSGREGKSLNIHVFENKTGYGHEEWLFNSSRLINGYHYAFIQPINRYRDKYIGEKFNISFYTINGDGQRFWLGKINNITVVSPEESLQILDIYRKNNWISEMAEEISAVNGDSKKFYKITKKHPSNFANIKFKSEDMEELLHEPLQISSKDRVILTPRYQLLYKTREPKLSVYTGDGFIFKPGFGFKKEKTKAKYEKKGADVDLLHNKIEHFVCEQLSKRSGRNNVGSNIDCGHGSEIDIVEKQNNNYIFYEIKTAHTLKLCIRTAMGQLLEYSYYPNTDLAKKIIIVSYHKINPDVQKYLILLRKKFKIPVYYRYFNTENNILEKQEY